MSYGRNFDPEPPRCAVCDTRVGSGMSHCEGTWCGRAVRKERIRKDEFDPANENHFRLQSRGGAWRYYRRVV